MEIVIIIQYCKVEKRMSLVLIVVSLCKVHFYHNIKNEITQNISLTNFHVFLSVNHFVTLSAV